MAGFDRGLRVHSVIRPVCRREVGESLRGDFNETLEVMHPTDDELSGAELCADAPKARKTTGESAPAPTGRRWWTLLAVSAAQLLVVLDGTIVNIALPSAQSALGMSDASRQWARTSFRSTWCRRWS